MRPYGGVRKKGRDKDGGVGVREHHIWVITENQEWIERDRCGLGGEEGQKYSMKWRWGVQGGGANR